MYMQRMLLAIEYLRRKYNSTKNFDERSKTARRLQLEILNLYEYNNGERCGRFDKSH